MSRSEQKPATFEIGARRALIAAALALLTGAAVHGLAYLAGPHWVALFGAPPRVIGSAGRGTWLAPISTCMIMAFLAGLALYCFAGAGTIRQHPFTRVVLSVAGPVFIARGLIVLPMLLTGHAKWITPLGRFNAAEPAFIVGSTIVLLIGLAMLVGLKLAPPARRPNDR